MEVTIVFFLLVVTSSILHTVVTNKNIQRKKEGRDMCRWKPIVRNGKLKGGIGAGTFHRLGDTPNMETCIDLCCSMDVCGVAFKNKDDCFGVECNSEDSCASVPADSNDVAVEIAHVRAGHKSANLTDMSMAGQCRPSPIYKEVTLKGGINAGTYKDVGGVNTIEECQSKCCEFPACDLAFMLAGSCYLVGCYDQKQCTMQPAKESKFHPMISYVTRWNGEGVKHTVLLQEKGVQYTCPKMAPLVKVTLKGGLQAGDFTDVGKVANLGQCYDICCQQDRCDLAFMLGQNCFSVQCRDKRLCVTTPAQPSIFNPQIAYVSKRDRMGIAKSGIAKAPTTGVSGECPKTKSFEKMTLKGGVDAGAYKDHGKVKDMEVCRRICCEMTECHLAFMLGTNCFSVKCASVDACRAQKAKPSAYYPKISYIRKVGSNELLPDMALLVNNTNITPVSGNVIAGAIGTSVFRGNEAASIQQKSAQTIPVAQSQSIPVVQLPNMQEKSITTDTQGFAVTPNGLVPLTPSVPGADSGQNMQSTKELPKKIEPTVNQVSASLQTNQVSAALPVNNTTPSNAVSANLQEKKPDTASSPVEVKSQTASEPKDNNTSAMKVDASGSVVNVEAPGSEKDKELMNALEAAENVTQKSNIMPINQEKCMPGILKTNVTLKGGRKAGEFIEVKGLKDMKSCVKRCCEDRDTKCNLAFMLGNTCYSVSCKNKELCRTVPAPPTKFNPLVQYVRGLEEEPMPSTTASTTTAKKEVDVSSIDSIKAPEETSEENSNKAEVKPKIKTKLKTCVSQPVVKKKSIRGGKKAGKFKVFKDIKDMNACISKCCSLKQQCDVAYMENSKCFSIQCFKKSACTAVDLRESEVNPMFAYMDHFLEKIDEEEAEIDFATDIADDSACLNVEIASNKTLKGGTRAGKFRPMGKKNMKSCINSCCDRPDCDVAYLLNGHCYAVECSDGKLCQTTGEPSRAGDDVQLAYMNKVGLDEKRRDYMVVYIIVGSLAFATTLGGLIWVVFAFSRKQRIRKSKKRLLDDDDDEEPFENILHKRPSHTRYRQPKY